MRRIDGKVEVTLFFVFLVFLVGIVLVLVSWPFSSPTESEAPSLVYHGWVDRIDIMPERGIYTNNAVAVTPSGIVLIFSSTIDYCDGDSVTTITEWDRWDGDITRITQIEAGDYYLYKMESGDYLLSKVEISKVATIAEIK